MQIRPCPILSTVFALGGLVMPLAAQVSATGVTDLYLAAAGSTLNQLPAATPLTNAVLQVTASTTSGPNANAFANSHLASAAPFQLATHVGGQSSSVGASAVAEVVITLHAAQPVVGTVGVFWSSTGTAIQTSAAMAMVDIYDDGVAELLMLHFLSSGQADFPVSFGPGTMRIRTSARATLPGGWIATNVQATLLVEFRPGPPGASIVSTPSTCVGGPLSSLYGNFDYERRVQFRLFGPVPNTVQLGVLVLGSTVTATPLPIPPHCALLTDPFFVRWMSPAELGNAPILCGPLAMPPPFTFRVQAVSLWPDGRAWTSNCLTIAAQ